MSLLENKPLLYSVVGVLAACRFIAVPVFEWQNEQLQSTESAQKRWYKAQLLLENETEFEQQLQQLSAANAEMSRWLVPPGPMLPTQLGLQREIEAKARDLGVQVRGINWLDSTVGEQVGELRAKISVTANSEELVGFHLYLENYPKVSRIDDIMVRAERWAKGRSRKVVADFELVIAQRQGESE